MLLTVAVIVTARDVATAATLAVKLTLLFPEGTVTYAGTFTALLLLVRATLMPPLGAVPLRVTVQSSVPDPVMDAVLHEITLTEGGVVVPVPFKVTTAVVFVEELLLIVSCPAAGPVVVGSNCTDIAIDCPGLSEAGKLPPDAVKPVPVAVTELIVRAEVPEDVRVTDFVTAVFRTTLPNDRLDALTLSIAVVAFS